MAHELQKYKPDYYTGILEMDTLLETEQADIDTLWLNISTMDQPDPDSLPNRGVLDNQFIQTADLGKITELEALFNILADPTTEDIVFRRARLLNRYSLQPPFSEPWLRQQLDMLIGVGQYTLTVIPDTYTFIVRSSAQNQSYYTEIAATIAYVKPCNMVFINQPLVPHGLHVAEGVELYNWHYNYQLGTTWNLGQKPFLSFIDGGQIVVPGTGSVQSGLLADVAAFTASDVTQVRINGSVIINTFDVKNSSAGVATITYDVSPAQAATITLVELLNSSGTVLTSSPVYIPNVLGVQMQHTITVKEGN